MAHIHLDPVGGVAGDMFCAAILDAHPQLYQPLQETLALLNPPQEITVELLKQAGTLRGKRFIVQDKISHSHHHHHNTFKSIKKMLDESALPKNVSETAIEIFSALAQAEGYVHEKPADEVTFHEVGNWDSIIDIVSAAFLIQSAEIKSASTAPLPIGSGKINCAHGLISIPAPATVYLLKGFKVFDDGISGERITPTGAAILHFLKPCNHLPDDLILQNSGCGYGSKVFDEIPNNLRILFFKSQAGGIKTNLPEYSQSDEVIIINFDIDDQSHEDIAIALDKLSNSQGVLSVSNIHALGKKGRQLSRIELLVEQDNFDTIVSQCFSETTTIGLRWQPISRILLKRKQFNIQLNGEKIPVKVVNRPDNRSTAKIESSYLKKLDSAELRRSIAEQAIEIAKTKTNESK